LDNPEKSQFEIEDFCRYATNMVYSVVFPSMKQIEDEEIFSTDSGLFAQQKRLRSTAMEVVVAYPSNYIETEYAFSISSLDGIKAYYEKAVNTQKQYVIQCSVCKNYFLSKNRRKASCSKACATEKARDNREYRRSKEDKLALEQLNNRERNYWNRQLNKLEQAVETGELVGVSIEGIRKAKGDFVKAKKDKLKEVRTGKQSLEDMDEWYRKQRNELDKILRANGLL